MARITTKPHALHALGSPHPGRTLGITFLGLCLLGSSAMAQVSPEKTAGESLQEDSGIAEGSSRTGGLHALQSDTISRYGAGSGLEGSQDEIRAYNNTAVGHEALRGNTLGFANTAVGRYALTTNTIGQANTGVGRYALSSNTIGSNNTAMGQAALASNTTGYSNSAHGQAALYSNTTGSRNAASGYQALYSNTTARNNTAIGYKALHYNTTGLDNTANGMEALFSNTTGHQNTASGVQALYANTTGFENTATGRYALSANTVGQNNMASGHNALYANTQGHRNTASGSGALFNNTLGNNNIAVGHNAGYSVTMGHHNVMIGSYGAPGDTHTIRVGHTENQTRAFVAGIWGKTAGQNDAMAVLIDSSGQLGTISSSGRYKEDVLPMAEHSAALSLLKPVTFRYKQAFEDGSKPIQYGLIAEQVAAVFPDLVISNEQGQPEVVKYHLLSSLLVNELQKLSQRHEVLRDEKDREMAVMAKANAELHERVARLEELELSRSPLGVGNEADSRLHQTVSLSAIDSGLGD